MPVSCRDKQIKNIWIFKGDLIKTTNRHMFPKTPPAAEFKTSKLLSIIALVVFESAMYVPLLLPLLSVVEPLLLMTAKNSNGKLL